MFYAFAVFMIVGIVLTTWFFIKSLQDEEAPVDNYKIKVGDDGRWSILRNDQIAGVDTWKFIGSFNEKEDAEQALNCFESCK